MRTPIQEAALEWLLENDLEYVIEQIADLDPPAPNSGPNAWTHAVITVCRSAVKWMRP